jgi:2-amino-4-hydroxy-6-hydroxymethyldihydropteridine diphosphokinase
MTKTFISVGSNIEPEKNVKKAISLLATKVRITAVSTVYSTEPDGRPEQDRYYNCVVEVDTDKSPIGLTYQVLKPLENVLGRRRTMDKSASRTIDLDLVLYNDLVLKTGEITLPDPLIRKRPFLARGLSELAPDLALPGAELTAAQAASCLGAAGMIPLPEYSEELRKEVRYAAEHRENRSIGKGTPAGNR